jgi:hypothetical protein
VDGLRALWTKRRYGLATLFAAFAKGVLTNISGLPRRNSLDVRLLRRTLACLAVGSIGAVILGIGVVQAKPATHGGSRVILPSLTCGVGTTIILVAAVANAVTTYRARRGLTQRP